MNASEPESAARPSLSEAAKAEQRRKLDEAVAEQSKTQTVVPPAKSETPSGSIIIRDQYGFRPGEAILEHDVNKIIGLHVELTNTPRRMLETAITIGEFFTEVKSKVFHGSWQKFIEEKSPRPRRLKRK